MPVMPALPTNPAMPNQQQNLNPTNQKDTLKQLQKQDKEIHDLKKDIDDTIDEITKKFEETFSKTAQLLCLLRLDMIADKLERINPRWASQIDGIANGIESSSWED
jgi:DNA-binding transcriptional regulator WhiA